jgi:hypothetical protein
MSFEQSLTNSLRFWILDLLEMVYLRISEESGLSLIIRARRSLILLIWDLMILALNDFAYR